MKEQSIHSTDEDEESQGAIGIPDYKGLNNAPSYKRSSLCRRICRENPLLPGGGMLLSNKHGACLFIRQRTFDYSFMFTDILP
jgi:hypothetical protein